MAISRSKKEAAVNEVESALEGATAVFLIDFVGLKALELNNLRQALKKLGANLRVIKKTLAKIAFRQTTFDFGPFDSHTGSLALVTAKADEIEIAKAITKSRKEKEALKILGGFIKEKDQVRFLDREMIMFVARIPSREVLLGQLAGVLQSPIGGLVATLNGNLQKLVFVLAKIKI